MELTIFYANEFLNTLVKGIDDDQNGEQNMECDQNANQKAKSRRLQNPRHGNNSLVILVTSPGSTK